MPGHLAEGFGAAHVQRRGRAEVGQPGRADREGGVEVQGVGQVDLGLDPHGALEGHLVGVHVGVPAVRGGLPATPGLGSGMNRTIASSTSRSTPLGRIRCANAATWSSTNPAAAGLRAMVCAGDPAGPPRRQVTGPDPGPGAGEPVPQLEGLTEVGLAGLGGQPDRGRELGHTELRDQRRAGSGDRDRGVAEPDRVADRLRRVQVRPRAARARSRSSLGGVGGGPAVPGVLEHPGSGVRCGVEAGAGPGSWLHSSRTGVRIKSGISRQSAREHRRSEGSPAGGGFRRAAPSSTTASASPEQAATTRRPLPVAALSTHASRSREEWPTRSRLAAQDQTSTVVTGRDESAGRSRDEAGRRGRPSRRPGRRPSRRCRCTARAVARAPGSRGRRPAPR